MLEFVFSFEAKVAEAISYVGTDVLFTFTFTIVI